MCSPCNTSPFHVLHSTKASVNVDMDISLSSERWSQVRDLLENFLGLSEGT